MNKPKFHIVFLGHVDHGKSTLMGRLLYETGSLPKEKMKEIEMISKRLGKEMELAFLSDHLQEEREKSMTIDTAHIYLSIGKQECVMIDVPGHLEFIQNMMTGTSRAEGAVLVIDAVQGIEAQTVKHLLLLKLLGIEFVIVVITKMDLVDYRQDIFENLQQKTEELLISLHLSAESYIPVSATEGINCTRKSSQMKWYRGATLIEKILAASFPVLTQEKKLRMPVQDIYKMDEKSIYVGQVTSGKIQEGKEVVLFPSEEKCQVKELIIFGEKRKEAVEGENVGVVLDSVNFLKRGDFILEATTQNVSEVKTHLFWVGKEALKVGDIFKLRCATQEVEAKVKQIDQCIQAEILHVVNEKGEVISENEAGEVVLQLKSPFLCEPFSKSKMLGRFVVEKDDVLLGAGIFIK